MIIEKNQYWDRLIDYYFDNIKYEVKDAPQNIYDWLEEEFAIVSNTGSTVLNCTDDKKATWFVLKFSS